MTGEPLVLLPGMNCSARLWGGVLDQLEGPAPQVVHGQLVQPTLDGCLAGLLETLPPRFALAGLSLGGIVAMALTRVAPERVTRLCLMSTNSRPPTPEQRAAWSVQREQLADGRTARDVQRDLLPVLLHADSRDKVIEETVLAMADDVGTEALDAQLALQATRVDERPALAHVTVPTLVLAAEGDALCPVARHQEIRDLVPGARLVVIPGVGHLVPLEAPRAVAAALADWLAG